jgi:predicted transcriptional regulator
MTATISNGQFSKIVSFAISPDMARKARVLAAMRDESRSDLIRRAVEAELQRLENESDEGEHLCRC